MLKHNIAKCLRVVDAISLYIKLLVCHIVVLQTRVHKS